MASAVALWPAVAMALATTMARMAGRRKAGGEEGGRQAAVVADADSVEADAKVQGDRVGRWVAGVASHVEELVGEGVGLMVQRAGEVEWRPGLIAAAAVSAASKAAKAAARSEGQRMARWVVVAEWAWATATASGC